MYGFKISDDEWQGFFLMYFGHDLSPFINITHLYIEKFDPKWNSLEKQNILKNSFTKGLCMLTVAVTASVSQTLYQSCGQAKTNYVNVQYDSYKSDISLNLTDQLNLIDVRTE